jgi:hypothetical protein
MSSTSTVDIETFICSQISATLAKYSNLSNSEIHEMYVRLASSLLPYKNYVLVSDSAKDGVAFVDGMKVCFPHAPKITVIEREALDRLVIDKDTTIISFYMLGGRLPDSVGFREDIYSFGNMLTRVVLVCSGLTSDMAGGRMEQMRREVAKRFAGPTIFMKHTLAIDTMTSIFDFPPSFISTLDS